MTNLPRTGRAFVDTVGVASPDARTDKEPLVEPRRVSPLHTQGVRLGLGYQPGAASPPKTGSLIGRRFKLGADEAGFGSRGPSIPAARRARSPRGRTPATTHGGGRSAPAARLGSGLSPPLRPSETNSPGTAGSGVAGDPAILGRSRINSPTRLWKLWKNDFGCGTADAARFGRFGLTQRRPGDFTTIGPVWDHSNPEACGNPGADPGSIIFLNT